MASLTDPRAYHIISYATFVGTTFFQSFIAGPVAFKTLPRPLFSRLQQTTFPVFFSVQTVLSALMVLTLPGDVTVLTGGGGRRHNAGLAGFVDSSGLWTNTIPLAIMLLSSLANLSFVGPLTTKTMKQRHHQETRDGKKSYDAGPHSPDMERLNRTFGILHSASTLLNLFGWGASLYYGFVLAQKL